MRRLLLMLFVALLIGSVAFIIGTSSQLPPRVATHFGGTGQINGSMTRDGYLLFILAFATLLPLLIIAAFAGLPLIVPSKLHVPNRDYWLAPSRRDESLAAVGAFGAALGCLLTVLAAGIHEVIVQANASIPPQLPGPMFWAVLGGFLVAFLGWQAMFFLRFRASG